MFDYEFLIRANVADTASLAHRPTPIAMMRFHENLRTHVDRVGPEIVFSNIHGAPFGALRQLLLESGIDPDLNGANGCQRLQSPRGWSTFARFAPPLSWRARHEMTPFGLYAARIAALSDGHSSSIDVLEMMASQVASRLPQMLESDDVPLLGERDLDFLTVMSGCDLRGLSGFECVVDGDRYSWNVPSPAGEPDGVMRPVNMSALLRATKPSMPLPKLEDVLAQRVLSAELILHTAGIIPKNVVASVAKNDWLRFIAEHGPYPADDGAVDPQRAMQARQYEGAMYCELAPQWHRQLSVRPANVIDGYVLIDTYNEPVAAETFARARALADLPYDLGDFARCLVRKTDQGLRLDPALPTLNHVEFDQGGVSVTTAKGKLRFVDPVLSVETLPELW